jgi:hypothetical protein
MIKTDTILNIVGIGLLILGGASGVALFMRALTKNENLQHGPGVTTLWGLFLIGILAGLMLIAASNTP